MGRSKPDFNLNRVLRELRQAATSRPAKGRTFFQVFRRYLQARCRTA